MFEPHIYKYIYKVRFKRETLFSKAHYSFALYRDTPIITEEDKKEVKKFVKRRHPFSKCQVLSAEILESSAEYFKTEKAPKFVEF